MPRYQVKHYFWVYLWGYFWKRLSFDSVDWVKKTSLAVWWASSKLLSTWIQQKVREGQILSLFLSWDVHLLFALGCWSYWFLGLFGLGLTYTISSSVSQTFGFELNCTTGFPDSPACRWQIVGFLSFHNHMGQFL